MTQRSSNWKQGALAAGKIALVLLLVVGFFGSMAYVNWLFQKPPTGAHSEIVVEFYTDGSPLCQLQAKVIAQLEAEYEGPITFKTIDIRQNPEVTKSYEGDEFGAVTSVPRIRISQHWLDKDGKRLSGGWSSSGAEPKRNLVQMIEGAAASNRQYWPATPIKRNRPPTP